MDADVQLKDFNNIFSLDGKVALITGGSRGLGLNVASGFMQSGCSKVYIVSRKSDACERAARALNALPNKRADAQAIPVPADTASLAEIERLVAEVRKTTDHIDILFANAGAGWKEPFETHSERGFRKVLELNVQSVFFTIQKFEPLLRRRASLEDPSRIIITGSVTGLGIGTLGANATYGYSVSKAAAMHLAKQLAVELGPRGILTNAIAPGFFPTKMTTGLMEKEGGQSKFAADTPNRRLGRPEDVAALVVFLASRAGSHINGEIITTDGGSLLAKGRL
ncbi:hypothetical protein VTO42DRAFT_5089 [Malbranchea cinnamomea]